MVNRENDSFSKESSLNNSLEGLSVVYIGDVLGAFACRHLIDLGASVSLVEFGSVPLAPDAVSFNHYYAGAVRHTRCKSVGEGIDVAAGADVIILASMESEVCGEQVGTIAKTLQAQNPSATVCCITSYGLTGPWKDRAGTDLNLLAAGGFLGSSGYDDGAETGLPIAASGGQSIHVAGMMAVMATLASVLEAETIAQNGGTKNVLDISAQHSLAVSTEMAIPFWDYQGKDVVRKTGRHALPSSSPRWQHRCADGKYFLAMPLYIDDKRFDGLKSWMEAEGFEHALEDEKFTTQASREQYMHEVVGEIGRFASEHQSGWLFEESQKRRLPWSPLNTAFECIEDQHFTDHRSTIETIDTADASVKRARLPFLISGKRSEAN